MIRSYLIVEGPHDAAFVGRFLKLADVSVVQSFSELDPFWQRLVPREFPPDDDLLKRMPVPLFFSGKTHSVAISIAKGDSRIAETLEETLAVADWDIHDLEGLGIILDADKQTPNQRFRKIRDEVRKRLQNLDITLPLPDDPGHVAEGASPKTGIFVLPDNGIPGTLEDLLIQCSEKSYPRLLAAADCFIHDIVSDVAGYASSEKRDFFSPSGLNKATIGAIANVLRPGKAVQVSIQDNRWVTAHTLTLPELSDFNHFIRCLLSI